MSDPATSSSPSGNVNPHRGLLILITGLLGFSCFLFGIAAFVLAKSDLDGMKSGSVDPAGRSLTKVGMTLGVMGAIVQAIIVLYLLLYADGGLIADTPTSPTNS